MSFFQDEKSGENSWRAMLQKISQGIEKRPIQKKLLELMGKKANLENRLVELTKSRDGLLNLLKNSPMMAGAQNSQRSLEDATTMNSKIKELVQEESERSKQYQAEIERLQEVRKELTDKLAVEEKTARDSKQRSEELEQKLKESNETLNTLKDQLAEQMAQHREKESELQIKLDEANGAYQKLLKAYQEQSVQCLQSFDQLGALRKTSEGMVTQLAQEQQKLEDSKRRCEEQEKALQDRTTELDRLKQELEKQVSEKGKPETGLREKIESAKVSVEKAQEALNEESARRDTLDKQWKELSQSREELNKKLLEREKECDDLRKKSQDLESRLQASTLEMEAVKKDLTTHAQERDNRESKLREELRQAQANVEVVKADYHEQTSFHQRSTNEVISLREAQVELNAALASERAAAEQSKQCITELEQQLKERTSELERLKVELERQIEGRTSLESEYENLSKANKTLQDELSSARDAQSRDFTSDQAVSGGVSRLARLTADLDYERGQRARAEQRASSVAAQLKTLHEELRKHIDLDDDYQSKLNHLERRLHETEEELGKAKELLSKEQADRKLAEDQINANDAIGNQLREHAAALIEAKDLLQQSQKAQEDQEVRLRESLRTLQESQDRLQREIAARQKAEETMEEQRRSFNEQAQKNAQELTKVKSALQVATLERQQLESQILESRHSQLNELRVKRASINGFRQQLQTPLDHLLQATRRLLERELATEEKKLAESALENAFRLQESMKDESATEGNTTPSEGQKSSPSNTSQAA